MLRFFEFGLRPSAPAHCTVSVRDGVVPSNAVPCVGREACVPHPVFALDHCAAVVAGDALVLREGFALAGTTPAHLRILPLAEGFSFRGVIHAGTGRRLCLCLTPGHGIVVGMENIFPP